MSIQRCSLCSGETQWDDSANSVICIDCGNLEDASQTTLVNGDVYDTSQYRSHSPSGVFGALTAPALRAASGRILAGQSSKGARDASNSKELHEYIGSILRIIKHTSIRERVGFLFDRAMEVGQFRWGKQARLAALSCIMIAVRESNLGETLASVASAANESVAAISKVFVRTTKLLQIQSTSTEPALYIPSLQAYISTLLRSKSSLPPRVHAYLSPLDPACIVDTGTRLCSQLSSITVDQSGGHATTACAAYILAIEGNAMKPCPDVQQFSGILGQRFGGAGSGTSKWSIMDKYRSLLAVVKDWSKEIPWSRETGKAPRTKNERSEVAANLHDTLRLRSGKNNFHAEASSASSTPAPSTKRPISSIDPSEYEKASKRRIIEDSHMFLISPTGSRQDDSSRNKPAGPRDAPSRCDNLLHTAKPREGRLTLLSASRILDGREISDDELFDEGELESMLRTEAEVEILKATHQWDDLGHASGPKSADGASLLATGPVDPNTHGASMSSPTEDRNEAPLDEIPPEWI